MSNYPVLFSYLLIIFSLNIFVHKVKADTPANCTYEDVHGSWQFFESQKGLDKTVDCKSTSKDLVEKLSFEILILYLISKLHFCT
jgi:hypothetical protein